MCNAFGSPACVGALASKESTVGGGNGVFFPFPPQHTYGIKLAHSLQAVGYHVEAPGRVYVLSMCSIIGLDVW